jgi:phosphate-selective porin OprO/OprP
MYQLRWSLGFSISCPLSLLALFLLLVGPGSGAQADEGGWQAGWNNGVKWSSGDGNYTAQLGGRIVADFAGIAEDDALKTTIGGNGTGVEFRQARLYARGTAFGRLAWKGDYDFAAGTVKDVWVSLKKVPMVGNIKVGRFKEPFSLEQMMSLRFITFMERSLADTFSPGRSMGIQFNDVIMDKKMTWAIGVFRQMEDEFGDTVGFSDASAYQLTARGTAAPLYEMGGEQVVHLGLGYSHKFRDVGGGEDLRWRARPESHLAQRVADSGALDSQGANLLNVEAAAVAGPLSLQAEYSSAWTDLGVDGTSRSWGAYVEVSYFLTGEHRNYDRKKGVFVRNTILEPLGQGWGAWQIAARFSRLKVLNQTGENAGNIRDISVGLNWYLYSNLRLMANYIYSDVDNAVEAADGNANIFQMRAQVDF